MGNQPESASGRAKASPRIAPPDQPSPSLQGEVIMAGMPGRYTTIGAPERPTDMSPLALSHLASFRLVSGAHTHTQTHTQLDHHRLTPQSSDPPHTEHPLRPLAPDASMRAPLHHPATPRGACRLACLLPHARRWLCCASRPSIALIVLSRNVTLAPPLSPRPSRLRTTALCLAREFVRSSQRVFGLQTCLSQPRRYRISSRGTTVWLRCSS